MKEFSMCEACGEEVKVLYMTDDAWAVCDECFQKYFDQCKECGETKLVEELFEKENEYVCAKCF